MPNSLVVHPVKDFVLRFGKVSTNAPELPLLSPLLTFKQNVKTYILKHAWIYSLEQYVFYIESGPPEGTTLKLEWEKFEVCQY